MTGARVNNQKYRQVDCPYCQATVRRPCLTPPNNVVSLRGHHKGCIDRWEAAHGGRLSALEELAQVNDRNEKRWYASNYLDDDVTWGVVSDTNRFIARALSRKDAEFVARLYNERKALLDQVETLKEENARLRRSL